jgi:hypothetical protein
MSLMRPMTLIAAFGTMLVLAGCSGSTNNPADSAFPMARWGQARAGLDPESFTMRRILGQPDNLEPLREDASFTAREADGRTLRELLDVEGTRPNIYDQQEQREGTPPARRGSSTPPRAEARPEFNPNVDVAPRPPEPPVASQGLRPGQVLPGPSGGQVVTGGSGRTSTTIGPSGQSGSAVRDGGTVTLFGPDGSIRTVPAPR